jgi:hypothetical protein
MPGCGCGKKAAVKYEVTFANGQPKQTYPNLAEAQAALAAAGRPAGSSYRAVAG